MIGRDLFSLPSKKGTEALITHEILSKQAATLTMEINL